MEILSKKTCPLPKDGDEEKNMAHTSFTGE